MLMTLDCPVQAFAEFERSLKRDPNRFRSIYGAARAAEASGNLEAARDYYARLCDIAVHPVPPHARLGRIRRALETALQFIRALLPYVRGLAHTPRGHTYQQGSHQDSNHNAFRVLINDISSQGQFIQTGFE
jgi:tetratricopeptide (TPR) repeat protein